jgi:predicted AAA+ superfamily ATPase
MNFIPRKLSKSLLEAARYFPALVLVGPRQSGKTTLLRHLFPDHSYVTLDRPFLAEQAEQDPEQFLAQHPAPVLIDEVQYAPGLFRYIKIKIDENRHAKGHYILTGSQKFTLMKGVSESLAGRAAIMDFEGLSGLELLENHKIQNDANGINQLLIRGGFPELWQDVSRPVDLYLDSYIATYLERDVKQVLAVGNLRDFERFLRACALRSSQQLNKSELARDVGISVPTAGEWLSVLEALGQVYLLEPWFGNLTKRLVKSPKLYLAEPALMGYLCGLRQETLAQSPFVGAYWETLVYAELRKQFSFQGMKPRIWYYRDQSQNEADFVIEDGHKIHLYECKWTSSPTRAMASNLDKIEQVFAGSSSTYEVAYKKLVTRASETFTGDGLSYVSIFQGLLENVAGVE